MGLAQDIAIVLGISGVSQYESGIGRAAKATDKATQSMKSGLTDVAGALGATFSVGAIALFAKESVAKFAEFEQGAADLSAITGATGKDLAFFKQQAVDMGIGVTGGATATLKAFELIGSAKPELLASKEALAAVTKEAIALSDASGMDLPAAAKSATSALNQYGAAADQASRFVNVLAAGALAGASPIEASTQALEAFGSIANGANVSIEESVALIQQLADKSIVAGEAGTALRTILLKMSNAEILPPNAQADMKRLGINTKLVADANVPLRERLLEVGKAFKDTGALTHIFEEANVNAAKIIIGNVGRFDDLTKAVTGTTAAYDQAAIRNDTLTKSFTILQNQVGNAMIGLGDSLKPVIDDIIKGFLPAMGSVREIVGALIEPAEIVFGALADVGKALGIAGSEGGTFATIMNVISGAIKFMTLPARSIAWTIGKLAEAFVWAYEGINDFLDSAPFLKSVVDQLTLPFRALGAAVTWVGDALGITNSHADDAKKSYDGVVKNLAGIAKGMGATAAQTKAFAQGFDMSTIAGLSQGAAMREVTRQFNEYLHPAEACHDATVKTGKAMSGMGAATKEAAKELEFMRLGFVETSDAGMATAKSLKDALDAVGAAKDLADLESVFAENDKANQRDSSKMGPLKPLIDSMDVAAAKAEAYATKIKDTLAELGKSIKSTMIGAASDIAFGIGEAIGSGGSALDVFKSVLRDLLVQVPKMTGMALLNFAATVPGPQSLPLAVLGLGLIGASGILSGIFKASDNKKAKPQSIAADSGARAPQQSGQLGLSAFVDNSDPTQRLADALTGMTIVAQFGETSLDGTIQKANKRNLIRQGR